MRTLPALAAGLVLCVLVAGCGDDHDSAETSATTVAVTSTVVSTTTTIGTAEQMVPIELAADAPTCAEAAAERDIARLMSAFAAARTAGRGAEDCLTPEALKNYCDAAGATCTHHQLDFAPGPNCLYACYGGKANWFQADGRPTGGGSHDVYLQVRYSGDYPGANEFLEVSLRNGRLLISAAHTSA